MKTKRALEWIIAQEDAQVAEWLLTHDVTRCPRRYAVESNHAAADPGNGDETTAAAEPPARRQRGRPNRSAGRAVYLTAKKKREKQADESVVEPNLETMEIEE
jgi:hypothetical protein